MTTALDLVQNTVEKKPSEFATNFADLVQDRIRELTLAKRQEVATNLFGAQRQDEPEDADQVQEPEEQPETEPEEPVDTAEPEGEPNDQKTT